MALTIRYFFLSFQDPLPWSSCLEEWSDNTTYCINSSSTYRNDEMIAKIGSEKSIHSSAELYFM
jgi:hypothetical protein